ncbi:hypothetical protein L9F63_022894 [Diploptera punctata]|uniref:CHK kinase-like domain-containing protein n=1 Tax=Diploptera punctata TaxID=6984 RepID=A0AAD8EAI5_DIPPU|nr:hypothetical protein L9F63_022894 [Diploptera punctata]
MPKDSTKTDQFIPSWLNDEFLETALKSDDVCGDLKVTSSNIVRATAAGDNYLSLIYRATVQITTRGQSENRSLIVKCQPEGANLKEITKEYKLFDLETKMLKDVLPAMHKLLREANINFTPFSAKCLYSHCSPSLQVIVLEDLKEFGFEMAERTAGLDQDHCMLVMKKLAQFHAASLALKEKNPELLETFLDPCSKNMITEFGKYVQQFILGLCDEIEEKCEELKKYTGRIRKIGETVVQRLVEGRVGKMDEFSVLTHGDSWLNNMMFCYSTEDRQLLDMRMVDYQMCIWTSPAVDLLYFLNSSPAMDLLVDQEMFIEEYHRVLGETLSALGYQHLHITLDHLNQLIESRGFYGTLSVFGIRNAVLVDDESYVSADDGLRNDQIKCKYSKLFIESMKIQVPLMERRGWLV